VVRQLKTLAKSSVKKRSLLVSARKTSRSVALRHRAGNIREPVTKTEYSGSCPHHRLGVGILLNSKKIEQVKPGPDVQAHTSRGETRKRQGNIHDVNTRCEGDDIPTARVDELTWDQSADRVIKGSANGETLTGGVAPSGNLLRKNYKQEKRSGSEG